MPRWPIRSCQRCCTGSFELLYAIIATWWSSQVWSRNRPYSALASAAISPSRAVIIHPCLVRDIPAFLSSSLLATNRYFKVHHPSPHWLEYCLPYASDPLCHFVRLELSNFC